MSECVGLVWLSVLSDVAGSLSCRSGTGCDSWCVPAGAPDQQSQLAEGISDIATTVGSYISRKSDRDYPRTVFNKGVAGGELMAHKMTGVTLVLCGALRTLDISTTAGRKCARRIIPLPTWRLWVSFRQELWPTRFIFAGDAEAFHRTSTKR